ncbi:MAG TPA: protein-export chaperone SecB [Gammaproteobacteria bacterium]|nr:protein-export chaperone SecB [Gammaproteobacteria bacterium]
MSESEQEGATQADQPQQQFALQKIYLKDLSFETPNSPAIFTEQWEPAINVELQSSGKPLGENVHDVVLTVTVTAKLGDKTAYLVEVQQAGVFTVAGFSDEERAQMLGSYCPNILFPYAREAISDLVAKGGFPQMLLGPVNFDAMYAEHLQRQQQGQGDGEAAVH